MLQPKDVAAIDLAIMHASSRPAHEVQARTANAQILSSRHVRSRNGLWVKWRTGISHDQDRTRTARPDTNRSGVRTGCNIRTHQPDANHHPWSSMGTPTVNNIVRQEFIDLEIELVDDPIRNAVRLPELLNHLHNGAQGGAPRKEFDDEFVHLTWLDSVARNRNATDLLRGAGWRLPSFATGHVIQPSEKT